MKGGKYQRCSGCFQNKPERAFYWASSRTTSGTKRYRDKTCKECRKAARAARYAHQPEPAPSHYWADPLAAQFLRLPRFVLR